MSSGKDEDVPKDAGNQFGYNTHKKKKVTFTGSRVSLNSRGSHLYRVGRHKYKMDITQMNVNDGATC